MWETEKNGCRRFIFGQDAPDQAVRAARHCPHFRRDDEEECVSDDPVSCYNCRYRRWTQTSFECMKRT